MPVRAFKLANTAAVGSSTPMASGPNIRFVAADRERPRAGDEPSAIVRAISPDYFETFGIPMLAGRAFTVYFRPSAEADSRKIEYIGDVSPGEVIVLGNHGRRAVDHHQTEQGEPDSRDE